MKTLVIGLDCAAPDIAFTHPRLPNLRSLMMRGCYGRLESVVPPITVPAWMCMATSRDPGALGIYGFRNRTNYSYDRLGIVTSASITAPAIWDVLAAEGDRAVVIGVPPSYPPRTVNGVSIGCFLTPDSRTHDFTYPPSLKRDIVRLVGEYPVDVKNFRTDDKEWLRTEIYEMSRKHFAVVRHLLVSEPWDYFQFVEIGLDRIHHGFWKFHDPFHRRHEPGNRYANVISDYYEYLDEEIGRTIELVDDDTTVLVVSDHGAQRLDGGFCVNEWLYREGLLALHDRPSTPTPFSPALVDWSRTLAWSEGGYYARVFFNVEGREPNGVIPAAGYEDFLDDVRRRFEAIEDDAGRPMGSEVFRPRDVYREVRNVAPDLIVHFGRLFWRSIGGVGYETLHVQENDTGPDDCNHAQFGMFILAAAGLPIRGEVEGMHLLDVAPTLLELAGRQVPASMQGRSLCGRGESIAWTPVRS
jgi:predicted AlkP superfamily phosphohydrolase/phosphomutase